MGFVPNIGFVAAVRRDERHVAHARHADEIVRSDRLDFRPERREVVCVRHRHHGDAELLRGLGERRHTPLDGQRRVAVVAMDTDDGRCSVAHLRARLPVDLAAPERGDIARDAEKAMGK